jgi:antitoxin (DNA-binding transcriptional repressor) of toxin-antitoxin stability system
VAHGEEFTISKRGKPVARLVPIVTVASKPDVRQVIEELKAFSKGNTLGEGISVRDLIEEGRRFWHALTKELARETSRKQNPRGGLLPALQRSGDGRLRYTNRLRSFRF